MYWNVLAWYVLWYVILCILFLVCIANIGVYWYVVTFDMCRYWYVLVYILRLV